MVILLCLLRFWTVDCTFKAFCCQVYCRVQAWGNMSDLGTPLQKPSACTFPQLGSNIQCQWALTFHVTNTCNILDCPVNWLVKHWSKDCIDLTYNWLSEIQNRWPLAIKKTNQNTQEVNIWTLFIWTRQNSLQTFGMYCLLQSNKWTDLTRKRWIFVKLFQCKLFASSFAEVKFGYHGLGWQK